MAPELRVHALQRGPAGTGRCLDGLETAEEFVSVPAGPKGQEVTAIFVVVGVIFVGRVHVDIIDS